MKSGGQTKAVDIKVGRQLLCREKPNTRATSKCAKKLMATVTAAKKGLTAKQQKLWRKYVYTPALLQAKRFCFAKASQFVVGGSDWTGGNTALLTKRAQKKMYAGCVKNTLSGKTKFKGLFGKQHKWADFLISGAKMIKKLPLVLKGGTQSTRRRPKTIDPYVDDPYGTQSN